MRIVHNVSLTVDLEDQRNLAAIGFPVESGGFAAMRVDESDPRWPRLERWIVEREPGDLVWTEFSAEEVESADWAELTPTWHRGYPQPEDTYEAVTYGSTGCPACRVGRSQTAAFRFRGEPRWGRNGILQLNWIFDEYFVKPDIWERVFRPAGIPCRRVLSRGGDRELETVVQLVATETVPVVLSGAQYATCHVCGQRKYLPHTRGLFPPLESKPAANYVHTSQWFGSGGSAYRGAIASKEVVRAMKLHGVRGVEPWPLERS